MFTYAGATKILKGLNPGSPKHCGLEIVSGRHFPDDWQGSLITNDFRAHRVCRFVLSESGSGYASREQPEIIKTTHAAFRPDRRQDGSRRRALHRRLVQPDHSARRSRFSRRAPRPHARPHLARDRQRPRRWSSGHKLVGATVEHLLDALRASEDFTRLHAKLAAQERAAAVVCPSLAPGSRRSIRPIRSSSILRLEALWTYQSLDVVEPQLLTAAAALARSSRPGRGHARAECLAGAHSAGRQRCWPRRSTTSIRKSGSKRCGPWPSCSTAEAAEVAMRALDRPVDRFLDHALWLTARDLQAGLAAGADGRASSSFDGNVKHLTYLLASGRFAGGGGSADGFAAHRQAAARTARRACCCWSRHWAVPTSSARCSIWRWTTKTQPAARAELLAALSRAARMRKVQPAGDLQRDCPTARRARTSRCASRRSKRPGCGRSKLLRDRLTRSGRQAPKPRDAERHAALEAWRRWARPARRRCWHCARASNPAVLRAMAIAALASLDVQSAAAELLSTADAGCRPPIPADGDRGASSIARGRAALLERALSGQTLPADAAKLAVRAVRSSRREEPALVAALERRRRHHGRPRTLSPERTGRPGRGGRFARATPRAAKPCFAAPSKAASSATRSPAPADASVPTWSASAPARRSTT